MVRVAAAAKAEHGGLLGLGPVLPAQLHVASGAIVRIVAVGASPRLIGKAPEMDGVHVG